MRKKLRELGLKIGDYKTGVFNNITDVPDVMVGHFSLIEDITNTKKVRSGVTAILPHSGNLFKQKVLGSSYVINGFGKSVGLVQLEELGTIEAPIMLTNTFSVGAVLEGTIQYMLKQNSEIGESTGTINTIVGECNDSYLNDIRGLHIRPKHAIEAINNAEKGSFQEGSVGAGMGMSCFGWKGGVGSSSRIVALNQQEYVIGALVLSNFGQRRELLYQGFPVGLQLEKRLNGHLNQPDQKPRDGSVIIVIGTNLPLNDRQLKRIAKRATVGLARTGSHIHHGSGDIVITFSNSQKVAHEGEHIHIIKQINDNYLNSIFDATAEAVEESIWNSILSATTIKGHQGRERKQFPVNLFLSYVNNGNRYTE